MRCMFQPTLEYQLLEEQSKIVQCRILTVRECPGIDKWPMEMRIWHRLRILQTLIVTAGYLKNPYAAK
jgi:hypothetical protein